MAGKSKFPVGTILTVAAVGGVGYKLLTYLDTASNIKMEFAGVSFKDISAGRLRLKIAFRFLNPSLNDVKLEYVLANIKLEDNLIGEITETSFANLRKSNPDAFVLKAKNASTIPITISMPLVSGLLSVIETFVTGKTKRTVSVDGFWKAEGVIRQSFNIKDELSF